MFMTATNALLHVGGQHKANTREENEDCASSQKEGSQGRARNCGPDYKHLQKLTKYSGRTHALCKGKVEVLYVNTDPLVMHHTSAFPKRGKMKKSPRRERETKKKARVTYKKVRSFVMSKFDSENQLCFVCLSVCAMGVVGG